MSDRPFDEDELLELLGAVRDEQITSEQLARLEAILIHSAEARTYYLRFMAIHGLLEQSTIAFPVPQEAAPASTTPPMPSRPVWPIVLAGMAIAIAVGVGFVVWWAISGPTGEGTPPGNLPTIAWTPTPIGNAKFEKTGPNTLRLDRGEVRIETQGNAGHAPIVVETPAGKVSITGSDVLVGAYEVTDSEKKGENQMMHFTRVLVLTGMVTLINQHGSITGEANTLLATEPGRAPAKLVVEANTEFGLDLYRQLVKQQEEKNLFFSPYSISIALAMASEGARGKTADEFGNVLHFPKEARRIGADAQTIPWQTAMIHTGLAQVSRDLVGQAKKDAGGFDLRIANAFWAEQTYPFDPRFVKTLNDSYGTGGAFPCDFAAKSEAERQRINRWVENNTNQRIKDLMPAGSVGPLTRMVLTNAIYFKGDWVQKFDKRQTKPGNFTTITGKSVKAPMMSSKFDRVNFAFIGKGDPTQSLKTGVMGNFRLVELPYKGGLSMVLIAPDNVRGLPALEANLTAQTLRAWLSKLRAEEDVKVTLPRFKFTSDNELSELLKRLGLVRAFETPGENGADFSGMVQGGKRDLTVSGVHHKAFVAVNEEGTEAAAATGIGLKGGGPPKLPPQFVADRPFIFLIRDPKSGTVLFMGRVTDASGVANTDRSESDEAGLKQARETPTKHALYQPLKDAAGVAIIRAQRDRVDVDGMGGMVLKCRAVLNLKGEIKTGTISSILFGKNVMESEAGREFCDFFNPTYGTYTVVVPYRRDANRLVVDRVIDADEQALLLLSNIYGIPVDRLTSAVKTGK